MDFYNFNAMFSGATPPPPSSIIEIIELDKDGNMLLCEVQSAASENIKIEISDTETGTFSSYKSHTFDGEGPPYTAEFLVGEFSPNLTTNAGKWIRAACESLGGGLAYSEAVQIPA